MTSPGYRHLILIVDRSGSILALLKDMQGGYDAFIAEQSAVTGIRTTASLYQFSNQHEAVHQFAPLSDLAGYTITPRGSTALLDTIGDVITQEGELLAALPEGERPGKVICLICTDGHENASRTYTRAQIRSMISHQQDAYGWTFVYNGANQDAFAEASSMGISANTTMDYAPTAHGTQGTWGSASSMVTRGAASGNYIYTAEERSNAAK